MIDAESTDACVGRVSREPVDGALQDVPTEDARLPSSARSSTSKSSRLRTPRWPRSVVAADIDVARERRPRPRC